MIKTATDRFKTEGLLFQMKRINLHLAAQLDLHLKTPTMSGVQVYLMVYILRHHPDGTYLTELCRETGVSKPTLSALIKKLKEKDYLCFREDPRDDRKKEVLPSSRLLAEGQEFVEKASRMEAEICSALDQEDQDQLWKLSQKLLTQMAQMERRQKSKQTGGC